MDRPIMLEFKMDSKCNNIFIVLDVNEEKKELRTNI